MNNKNTITIECLKRHPKLAIFLHKKLWNWLADNPNKWNADWPLWKTNGGCVEMMIGYDVICSQTPGVCENCMLKWSNHPDGNCFKLSPSQPHSGLRYRYMHTRNPLKRKQLAQAIANLPLKNK